jgi:hypothetical protein
MAEIYTRLIKTIAGNGTTQLKIAPTVDTRVFELQCELTYAGGTNTLAGLMTAMREVRWKVGTNVKARCSGTVLRDWMLLHGTGYDFNGLPNTGAQVTFPFAPPWFLENVQDALAWNPRRLGGPITLEIDFVAGTNVTAIAYERVAEDLEAPSAGIITFEVLKPVAGGVAFFVDETIEPVGDIYGISVYPDSTNSREITPLSLYLGKGESFAHEALSSAQNDEQLERYGFSPAASGRTANVYDIVSVKGDALSRAWNLNRWGSAKLKIEAAAAMAGTCDVLIVRREDNDEKKR